jgi:hypothetical protein
VDAERRVVLRRLQWREPRTVRRRIRVEHWRFVKGHVSKGHVSKGRVVESTLQPGVEHPVVIDVLGHGVLLNDVEVVPVLPRVEDVRPLPTDLILVEPGVVVAPEQTVLVGGLVLRGRREAVLGAVVNRFAVEVRVDRVEFVEVAVVHCWVWCVRLVVCRCVSPPVPPNRAGVLAGCGAPATERRRAGASSRRRVPSHRSG